jgi:ABC-type glycerol-3-phosphate transport system substrate-binding protein
LTGKKGTAALLLAAMLGVTAGCGSGSGGTKQADAGGGSTKPTAAASAPVVSTEPVELTIYQSVVVTDDDFKRLFADPVKKKYPNISLKLIRPAQGARIPDLVVSGNVPDIILTYPGGFDEFIKLNLPTDLTPLVKKHNVDLSRFEPVIVDAIRNSSQNGELYALPYGVNFNALYYNKDIFDKFGVPYPKDGMTWDQTVDLGKKLTRSEGGIQYRGLDPENLSRVLSPLSLPWIEPGTEKINAEHETIKQVFQLVHDIYSIPGNTPAKLNDNAANVAKFFLTDKIVAMLPTVNIFNRMEEAEKGGLKWDLVQYPSHKAKPNTYGAADPHVMFLTSTSKHKDQAMQVMQVVTSDEVQTVSARATARVTPLKSMDIKKQIGADLPFLKGKNMEGIFKSQPAPVPKASPYSGGASKFMNEAFDKYMGGSDVNTVLREATEKISNYLRQEKAK